MGYWSFYFFARIGLYWAHVIDFHVWPNLVFALALSVPVPARPSWYPRFRNVVATLVAIALFWFDTGWPSPLRIVEQWHALSQFSGRYWIELIGRAWSWQIVGALLIGAGVHGVLARRVRLGVVALVLIAALSWLPWPRASGTPDDSPVAAANTADAGAPASAALADTAPRPVTLATSPSRDDEPPLTQAQLDQALSAFYEQEQHRGVKLPGQRGEVPPFDLLVLSICSLSWDDLTVAGLQNAPLLKRMDLLFRQFNSAASYSGPAVLRLLHGTCGQTPQAALYDPGAPDCYLFQQLERLGYKDSLLLNHDGTYDGFANQLQRLGGMNMKPVDHSGAPINLYGFDNSPIYDDYEVLSQWWRKQTSGASSKDRFAVLYNTITLHDGNRRQGQNAGNTLLTWPARARKLFSDIERMLALVEQSGRPTVVVLVPEHGAGLRGDNTQIPGLREFPTPRITHVPAGVALLNFGAKPADASPVMVEQVSSYSSLMAVVGTLMQPQSGSPWATLKHVGEVLPSEEWVAENDGTVVLSRDGRNYIKGRDGRWSH